VHLVGVNGCMFYFYPAIINNLINKVVRKAVDGCMFYFYHEIINNLISKVVWKVSKAWISFWITSAHHVSPVVHIGPGGYFEVLPSIVICILHLHDTNMQNWFSLGSLGFMPVEYQMITMQHHPNSF
jgi:hypothetical protein